MDPAQLLGLLRKDNEGQQKWKARFEYPSHDAARFVMDQIHPDENLSVPGITARLDGSSNIVLFTFEPGRVGDLAIVAQANGGTYLLTGLDRLPRSPIPGL
ncbi:hypothetical protein WMF27_20450 [Sorangium sp. So ce281]|uniref:hypothetical protein n=1 Tax=unclassified Sorangium TaxID=2621164 RepID=UPI003F5E7383